MPARNIYKQFADDSYYHIYSRGVNKQPIFLDNLDYEYFLSILKRYLSTDISKDSSRVIYKNFSSEIKLLSYCLMSNHFHLFIKQKNKDSMSRFMKSVITSYSMYFNKRYKRVGPLFQSRYLASLVDDESYLMHISRYIHLNPSKWRTYPYSSIDYYIGKKAASWIDVNEILELFDNNQDKYFEFVADYQSQKNLLDELKWELANDID